MAAKFIFAKNATDDYGALYRIAADGADISAIDANAYKIIDATDSQFNDVRLDKKEVKYDSSDSLTFQNTSVSWASEAELDTEIDALTNSVENNSSWSTQITTLKAKDFSSETFPCTKTIPELAEEKGMTWKSPLEYL